MRLNESNHLPNDVALCTQEDCLLKKDCLRHLALKSGNSEPVSMTQFPPVTKMDQGCNHQIPVIGNKLTK